MFNILLHFVASPIFIIALLNLYFVSLGRALLRRFVKNLPLIESITLSFPLGAGAVATAIFLLGLIGQIRFWTFVICISLSWLLSFKETISFLKELAGWIQSLPDRLSPLVAILSFFLLAHCLLNFIFSLAPPIGYDALNYHLVMAKYYATTHVLSVRPDIQWSFGPQGVEMLITLGMVLHSDILASLISLMLSFSLLFAIYTLGRRFLSRETSLLAAILFWCMPLVIHYAPLIKNDLGMSVFIVLACDQWLILTQEKVPVRSFLLLSIFLGFAAACKFTALPSILVIGASAIWGLGKRWPERETRRVLWLGFFLSISMCLPYFIRSYVLTGNPVYPNAYRIFGGPLWNLEMDKAFLERHEGTKSLMQFLIHPIHFSMANIYGGHIGSPLFLVFLPLLFYWRPLEKSLNRLLWASFWTYLVSYFCFDIHSRYYFPVLCFLSLPAAYAIQKTCQEKGMVRWTGSFFVACFLIFNLSVTYAFTKHRIPSALGMESRSSYLSRRLPFYPVIQYANEHTDPHDRFVLYGLPGYYLERDYVVANDYSAGIMFFTLKTALKLAERLRELQIRYVVAVEKIEKQRERLGWNLFHQLKEHGVLVRIYTKNGYSVYQLH